jgi:hypothetical protein
MTDPLFGLALLMLLCTLLGAALALVFAVRWMQ